MRWHRFWTIVVLQTLSGAADDREASKGCVDRLDSNDNLDEELLHFRMLQVSAEVLPKDHVNLERSDAPVPRRGYVVPHHSSRPRLSLAHWLTGAAEEKLLPFATAVLLPHAVAFLVAQVLMRRHGGTAVEVLQEKKEAPKSLSYIIKQAGPMWIIHLVAIFTFAAAAPSVEYLYLNYFARQSQPGIDCSVQMAAAPCTQSVTKVLKLQIIRGFVLPVVQFILGPALGAMSDAFGRRPAVLVIRTCLLISATGTMLVAWFPLPIWVDYALGVFSTVPWGAVPFAWYIDRFDHAPTIVYAVSLIEGSCIISEALGTAFGSFLSLNMAISVLFVGRAVTFCLALWVLPESLPEEKRMVFSWSSLMPTAALQALLQSPLVEKLTAILVINSFHWAGYYTIFGRFLQSHMAWARQNSYYSGLAEQVSQVLWLSFGVNLLVRAFGQSGLIAVSTCACVASNVLQMLSNKPWQIYANNLLFSGPSFMAPAVVSGIIGAQAPGEQGTLQSAVALVSQVAAALGPVAFATVYQLLDPAAPGAPSWTMDLYIIYGALFAVPALTLTFSLRRFMEGTQGKGDQRPES
ncbi:unnamed protein product [Durusdinium trenchii]|uniref:Uncharacterized protein n=1 Tax=Durusdinium trenchii TaxID=1381693 RepID=A0ABP0KQU4_9DINO